MTNSVPLDYLREQYPALAAKGGRQVFIGWMHRAAFRKAPAYSGEKADGACMVLYAPTERFPMSPTLAELRRDIRSSPADIARADDSIVEGAKEDGVELERAEFNAHAWAVIPDFEWRRMEDIAKTARTH